MKRVLLLLSLALFIIPIVSAEILISQPASIYSFGDQMNLNLSIAPAVATNGFLTVKLNCNGEESELHKIVYDLAAREKRDIALSLRLDSIVTGNLQGSCNIIAVYGAEERRSQAFMLSKDVSVAAGSSGTFFAPGESIPISGKAIKGNGNPLEGYVEASSEELGLVVTQAVNNGNFSLNVKIPEKAAAKGYLLNVMAYEKDSNGITINEGIITIPFNVRQVASKLDIALGSQEINPGEGLSYNVIIKDQGGNEMNEEASIRIYTPDNKVFSEEIAMSGVLQTFKSEKNYSYGFWKVAGKSGEIENERTFYVNPIQEVSFALKDDTLAVTNIGNVIYNKSIGVAINGVSTVKNLNLETGESKNFRLSAPDGNYEVKIKSNEEEEVVGSSFLTGRTISVNESSLNIAKATSFLVWFFLIFLVCGIAFVNYKKVSRKHYIGTTPKFARVSNESSKLIPVMRKSDKVPGGRENCSIVNINIKNLDEFRKSDGSAADTINRILGKAKEAKAKVQSEGNFKSFIFSPTLTKEQNNIMNAVNFAQITEKILNEHNRKYGQKIDFGIGVHQGEMIAENKSSGIEFTSIGNVALVARKLSDNSESNVLLSGEAHRKTLGKIKVEKLPEKGWRLHSVSNRESHSDFIHGFLNRQK